MVYAADLKSAVLHRTWGFESPLGHQIAMKTRSGKIVIVAFFILVLLSVGYFVLDYFALFQPIPTASRNPVSQKPTNSQNSPQSLGTPELIASGLEVPWSIAFTSPTRMLVAERPGRIREVVGGQLNPTPLLTIAQVSSTDEEGLMGLAIDPQYAQNKYVYISYAYPQDGGLFVRVARLIDQGTSLVEDTVLLDRVPAAQFHAGSRVKIGPDSKLYVTTGDALTKEDAQDATSLAGKILRLNLDGSVPADNPIAGSYVYSYGHRNPQGLAWLSAGELLSTEHGPSVFDGPAGGDEINHIVGGANYGWPVVSHEKSTDGMIDPLITFTPAVAPGSAAVAEDVLYFGALRGEGLYKVELSVAGGDVRVTDFTVVPGTDSLGRIREVVVGPDGALYFSTSNRDGRGEVRGGDDKIYRVGLLE